MRGAKLAIVEKRLKSVETAVDLLLDLNARVIQSLDNHEAQIDELKRQTLAMERRADAMERRADDMERRADATERRADSMERRADAMEQNIEELVRFNRQTRRLWIIVARKSNLLDDDDIKKWLEEDI